MKRRDLEQQLTRLGWCFTRHGGSHDVWTRGQDSLAVPRHTELNEYLARSLIRAASKE